MLAIDTEKRQIKLSMKQLVPTGLDEYLEEHKVGDAVSGRWALFLARSPGEETRDVWRARVRVAEAADGGAAGGVEDDLPVVEREEVAFRAGDAARGRVEVAVQEGAHGRLWWCRCHG